LRAELGNDLAIKAYRDGTLPFPDGAIIAALHWNEESSDADNEALAAGFPSAGLKSSFAESAVNAQFMVKDSKKTYGKADASADHPLNTWLLVMPSPTIACPRNPLAARHIDPLLPKWLPDLTVLDLRVGKRRFDIRFWRDRDETRFKVLRVTPMRLYPARPRVFLVVDESALA
jgi:hypothetical protein